MGEREQNMKFPESIHPFLRRHRIGVLTVLNEAGEPHSASLHYSWNEKSGNFLFFTRKGTLKYKAVASGSKKASMVIGFSEEEFCTLQMHGEAKVLEDAAAREIHFEKYHYLRKKADDDDAVFLEFIPNWYRYSDLKASEPLIASSED